QAYVKSLLAQDILRACRLCADLDDRQIAVQFAHHLTHRDGEGRRFTHRTNDEMHLAQFGDFLLPWRIEQRLHIFALAFVLSVSHDANNLDPTLVAGKPDRLAEHFPVGKELAHEGLIDDAYARCMRIVTGRKFAAAEEGNFHRRKIVLAHDLTHRVALWGSAFTLAGQ